MSQKWEKAGVSIIAKVSKYGNGLYLRIPKPILDAYGLKSGDSLKIKVEQLHRLIPSSDLERNPEVIAARQKEE